MWNKANGIDNSFIVPYSEQKSMSRSTTFDRDTTDMRLLRKTIIQFVDELAFELRSQQRMTSCITITIRYANWDTHTKQLQIPYCSTDDILTQKALELFERSYERRMLIRLIGVRFSSFVNGSYQIDLFSDSTKKISLFNVMDNIRNRFGHESLVKAVTI
jgi:DNA polymerase-4